MRGNKLDVPSATMLAKAGTEKGCMLFGIKHDQTEASFINESLGPADSILIASDLRVSAVLTECNVRRNKLDSESANVLAKVATEKRVMLFGIKHDQTVADFSSQGLGPVDAVLIASDLRVSAVITNLNLAQNDLTNHGRDMSGIQAIADALKSGMAVLTNLDLYGNSIGPEGAAAIAEALKSGMAVLTTLKCVF